MRNKSKSLIILYIFLFLSFAAFASAEGYQAVAPIPGVEAGGTPADYIASLYGWGIGIVGILALLQLVRGGIMYMVAGAVDTKNAAKGIITEAMIGLGLALASYLILNIVNPTLLELKMPELKEGFQESKIGRPTETTYVGETISKKTFDPVQKASLEAQGYKCTSEEITSAGATTTQYTCELAAGTAIIPGAETTYTATAAREILKSAGIAINHTNECTPGQSAGCTSLDKVRESTITGVLAMSNCNCNITITGGTEAGHSSGTYSHANGYKLDLRLPTTDGSNQIDKMDYSDPLNIYIFGKIGGNANLQKDTNYCGTDNNTYRLEKDHWDVVFGTCVK